jgi:hypothetical protein
MALRTIVQRISTWIRSIPPSAAAALAVVALALLAVGSVFMYRTYTFVEHDNQFCLSCHLMEEPFERFAQSEHRGLGCKACHQPTMMARTQMALAQVLERPEEITTHAEVPNSACASCHIEGDPQQWRLISNSIGHRVHMESDDPSLAGLMCVECHSASIHQFTATSRTCAQSGCHEDTPIQLGRMGGMTIHCVACHDFSRPVAEVSAAIDVSAMGVRPLQPRRDECLGCHEMRTLLADFPPDDPHEAACGACHNPHDQETPRQAQRTCATAGCHEQPDTLTPMHRGLSVGVLQECLQCHEAHDFRVDGSNCLACHQDIFRESPRPVPGVASHGIAARLIGLLQDTRAIFAQQQVQARPRRDVPLEFSHNRHREVACTQCHSTERAHGALIVTSIRECRECHHVPPTPAPCASCHRPGEFMATSHRVPQRFQLTAGPDRTRQLPFTHAGHDGIACADCHGPTPTRAVTVQCTGCHEQHHEPTRTCISCHVTPPADAHDVASHLTCAGSGCHTPVPFQGVPRTRNLCLSCHQDQVDHEPGGNCADCHPVPRPGTASIHGGPQLATVRPVREVQP